VRGIVNSVLKVPELLYITVWHGSVDKKGESYSKLYTDLNMAK